ncbi:MAG: hypothetical protein U1C71_01050, partial [archaeon]|nr:hypothetical protein [archaeon]
YVHIYNEYVKALIDSGRASEALGFRTWMIQKRRDFAKSPVGKTIRRAALPKRMKRRGRSLWDAMNRAAAVEKEKRAQSKKPSPKK